MTNPIQFDPATVERLAALDIGERAEVRVVMEPQPADGVEVVMMSNNVDLDGVPYKSNAMTVGQGHATQYWSCPTLPGTRLWVREVWAEGNPNHYWIDGKKHLQRTKPGNGKCFGILYRASFGAMLKPVCEGFSGWRSPVIMPRWASRISLTAIECKVEQVDDVWQWLATVERCEGGDDE